MTALAICFFVGAGLLALAAPSLTVSWGPRMNRRRHSNSREITTMGIIVTIFVSMVAAAVVVFVFGI